MAFLQINGVTIDVADGGASVGYEKFGAVDRSYMGKLRGTRRSKVRRWSISTIVSDPAVAAAIEGMINGDGQVWSFDNDLYSSKGLGPQSGYGVTVSATGGKYGGHVSVDSGTSLIFDPSLGAVPFTVMIWKKSGATWDHYGIDSLGVQYKNGAVHAPIVADDVLNWFTQSLSTFAIEGKTQAGVAAAAPYDDLLILPYLSPLSQVQAIYGLGSAHPSTPQVLVGGDIVSNDIAPVYAIGDVAEAEFVQGSFGGSFQNNLHRLKLTLREVEQAGR